LASSHLAQTLKAKSEIKSAVAQPKASRYLLNRYQ